MLGVQDSDTINRDDVIPHLDTNNVGLDALVHIGV
jgi:hypothetical protein